jgi:uridine kinase
MKTAACSIRQILKRDGNLVAYDRDRITTAIFKAAAAVGGSDRQTAERLAAEVEQQLVDAYGANATPTVEEIQDIVEAVMIRRGHVKTARAYIIYRHQRAQARAARAYSFETSDNIPYKKIYEVLRWNMDHRCETVEALNRIIEDGQMPTLVRDCEKRYDDEIGAGAAAILARLPAVRMVIIAGPSSSGKTTTTIKISERLRAVGVELVAINLDHYFFDLVLHPKDEFGDYDYETPQALDLTLINEHLARLLAGETIKTPHYDFKTGKRTLDVHELSLGRNQVLLIDSLHGLYEGMTSSIPARQKFKLYVETLGQVRTTDGVFMRWADNRLLRRMIRDSWSRNLQPLETLTHWHYVRRSELKNIIPFISSVDYLINSAQPFELPILKHRLFHFFPDALERYQSDAKRQDAYLRAKRAYEFLAPLHAVADDTCVPATSIVREFIGGSAYTY